MEKLPESRYIIRFNDCDPYGHLNNSKYIDYFINAREDHLRDHYDIDLKKWAAEGQTFVVSQHEIRYLRPAFYNESVDIRSALIGWGESWLQVEMCMFGTDRQLKAIMWTVFTRVHPTTGKRHAHPPPFQSFIDNALIEVPVEKGLSARIDTLRSQPQL